MGRPVKKLAIPLLTVLSFLAISTYAIAARDFPDVQATVTDIPDVLSDVDEERLTQTLKDLKEFNNMPGVIVIAKSTSEWDFIEYGHDFFDHLRVKRLVDNTGFLIYLSTQDKKMTFVMGRDLVRGGVLTDEDARDIRQRLNTSLADGDYFDGLSGSLAKLRQITGAAELEEAGRERGNWMMLSGLVIIIAALFWNIRRRRTKLRDSFE